MVKKKAKNFLKISIGFLIFFNIMAFADVNEEIMSSQCSAYAARSKSVPSEVFMSICRDVCIPASEGNSQKFQSCIDEIK
ncbi:MAG: hypothetical protein ACE365_06430 [Gammaproteobacteria bacterium]